MQPQPVYPTVPAGRADPARPNVIPDTALLTGSWECIKVTPQAAS